MPPPVGLSTTTLHSHLARVTGDNRFTATALHAHLAGIAGDASFTMDALQSHLERLVGNDAFADVAFRLEDGEPSVPAHRLLLCSGTSGYFSALLAGGFSEAHATGKLELTLPGESWSRATLLQVLRFLYTGTEPPCVHDDAQDADALMRILQAADVLTIEPLRRLCESKLAQAVDEEQVLEVLLLADDKRTRGSFHETFFLSMFKELSFFFYLLFLFEIVG